MAWKDVAPGLSLADYTIRTVPERMAGLEEGDPLRPVLSQAPDLLDALGRLQERLTEG